MSAGRHCFRRKNYATFYTSQSSMEREVERSLKKKNMDLHRSNKPDRPEPVLRDMPTTSKTRPKDKKKKDADSSGSPSPVTAKRLRQVRSMLRKNESPRSGLKPAHTLGTRSASDYGLVTVGKLLAEQRKLSDFGLLPPVPVPSSFLSPSELRHTQPSPARRAAKMPPRPPKRSLKDRLRNLRLGGSDDNNNPGPSNSQSSHSVRSTATTANTLPTPDEPTNIRKSISFNEAAISTYKASKKNKKKVRREANTRKSQGGEGSARGRRSTLIADAPLTIAQTDATQMFPEPRQIPVCQHPFTSRNDQTLVWSFHSSSSDEPRCKQ